MAKYTSEPPSHSFWVVMTSAGTPPSPAPGIVPARACVQHFTLSKPLVTAVLDARKGSQEILLPAPATFSELKLVVNSTYPGQNAWGSIGEIEGFDDTGRNVLLAPPRYAPRAKPEAVLATYQQIKAADAERPVFMTLTGHFHPHFTQWTNAQRDSLYPAYIQAADVVGYDIYPIYGWNKPEWIHLVHDATELLASRTFPLKMGLLMLAGLNAVAFHTGPWQSVKAWDVGGRAPLAARASVAASLAIWVAIIACGRFLAYAGGRA